MPESTTVLFFYPRRQSADEKYHRRVRGWRYHLTALRAVDLLGCVPDLTPVREGRFYALASDEVEIFSRAARGAGAATLWQWPLRRRRRLRGAGSFSGEGAISCTQRASGTYSCAGSGPLRALDPAEFFLSRFARQGGAPEQNRCLGAAQLHGGGLEHVRGSHGLALRYNLHARARRRRRRRRRSAGQPADRPGPGPTARMASIDASGFGPASPG